MNIHELNTKAITNPAYVALDDGSDTYKLDLNAKLSTMQGSISGAESNISTLQDDVEDLQENPVIYHGECSTSASNTTKTVSVIGFDGKEGDLLVVRFINGNTATSFQMNVSSTGARNTLFFNGTSALEITPNSEILFEVVEVATDTLGYYFVGLYPKEKFEEIDSDITDLKSNLSYLDDGYASIDKLGLTWANGGLKSGNLRTDQPYRVSMTDVYTATKDIFVKIASGFKIGIHQFSDASTFSYDYGWKTNLVRIDSGTIFKMGIARVSENTSETADINKFISALKIYSDIGEYTLGNNDELVSELAKSTAKESMTFTEVDSSDITMVSGKLIHKNNLVGNVFGDQSVGGSAYFYIECTKGDVFEVGFRSRDADRYHIAFADSNNIILDAQVRGSGSNYIYTDYVVIAPVGATRLYVGSTSNVVPNTGGINTLKKGYYDVAKASVVGDFFTKGDHFYVGDRIDLTAKHGYTFKNIGIVADHYTPSVTFLNTTAQGMGIYDGKAICFLKYGGLIVWDLENQSVDLELVVSFLSTAHCNSVSLGDFYDSSDDFPLIYLSECLSATESKCFVIRLTGGIATLIQTITYSNNDLIYTGPFDWILDTDNGLISTYGISSNGHTICTFALPSVSAGDITLIASDVIDSWLIEDYMGSYSINVYQGHLLYNGMLFLPDGAWANNTIYVFDMYAHTLRNVIPCGWRSNEFEDVDIYDGKLIIYSGSTAYGRFDALTFRA